MEHIQERFLHMQGAMNLDLNEKVKTMQSNGKKIYHLGFGQSPFPVPDFAQEALKKHAGEAEYLAVKGALQTREEICKYHARIDRFEHFSADDVIIGPGSKELIFLLMNVVCGDVYLLAPTWTTYRPQAVIAGRNVHIIETTAAQGWKLTPSALASATANAVRGSVLIFCNPDNPTGACYTANEVEELAAVVKKANLLVVCDEIYARLKYNGKHHSLVTHVPERAILSSGISKWASCGGWRMGYHMYPKELKPILNAVQAIASNTYTCCSAPVQHAARSLMSFGQDESDFAEHSARILCAVGNFCCDQLSKAGVKVVRPEAGYYIFPDFEPFRARFEARGISNGAQMCDAILKEARVCLLAGGPAFLHDPSRYTVRLCYINFDGTDALRASKSLGLSCPLPEDFVRNYCAETVDAITAIVRWLETLQFEKSG